MSYHGILLVDKPKDCTSHDVVARLRKILQMKEVGHCGTLDPMASGLMVCLLGEATKLSHYILEEDKSYRVSVQLGLETDTYDTTGNIIKKTPVDISAELIRKEVLSLQGLMSLPVPLYSAVKVDGKKLYEYAREQKEVEIPVKDMKFYDLKIVEQSLDGIQVDMKCSKGSYVRAWVHLLGQRLMTGAAMSGLVRTSSMPYSLDQAVSLDKIEELYAHGSLGEALIPSATALPHYKWIRVGGLDLTLILNGQISHNLKAKLISVFNPGVDEGVKILSQKTGDLMALVGLESPRGFVIRRVFRY